MRTDAPSIGSTYPTILLGHSRSRADVKHHVAFCKPMFGASLAIAWLISASSLTISCELGFESGEWQSRQ
jgi:hypothetical protein